MTENTQKIETIRKISINKNVKKTSKQTTITTQNFSKKHMADFGLQKIRCNPLWQFLQRLESALRGQGVFFSEISVLNMLVTS